jgi:hypothetical protein
MNRCDVTRSGSDMTAAEDPARSDLASAESFVAVLDRALEDVYNEVLVPQSRCVDHLLDLFNATDNDTLLRLTIDALRGIRRLRVVKGVDIHDALSLIGVAANVELATVEA